MTLTVQLDPGRVEVAFLAAPILELARFGHDRLHPVLELRLRDRNGARYRDDHLPLRRKRGQTSPVPRESEDLILVSVELVDLLVRGVAVLLGLANDALGCKVSSRVEHLLPAKTGTRGDLRH